MRKSINGLLVIADIRYGFEFFDESLMGRGRFLDVRQICIIDP